MLMPSKGITLIMIATLAFAIMNSFAKNLGGFHFMQVVFFRSFGSYIFIFPYMLYAGTSFKGNNVKPLLLRAIAGLISLSCFFFVVQRIPLGSALSIRYLGPIFGAMMAAYYLKEKVSFMQWISFSIAFAGVIVLKGFDLRIDYLSLFLIIMSAVFVGMVFVLIRYLSDKEDPLTIISYFMLLSILVSFFFVGQWRWPLGIEWVSALSIGLFGLVGQLCMTIAFRSEEASVLAPFKYLELVYAMLIGFFFFGESYRVMALLGISLIIAGMILNVIAKKRSPKIPA